MTCHNVIIPRRNCLVDIDLFTLLSYICTLKHSSQLPIFTVLVCHFHIVTFYIHCEKILKYSNKIVIIISL